MVQVDVFWSYGIGAGIAMANSRQIKKKEVTGFDGTAFRDALLFLALLFAPSGVWLVTAFPYWETMHVAKVFSDIPPWLITVFAITNITQGILGFAVARWFIKRNNVYGAALNWAAAYFFLYFILIHGWDGTGYQRFFSATPEALVNWEWARAAEWVVSPVGISLAVIGIAFIPTLLLMMSRPILAGLKQDPKVSPKALAAASVGKLSLSLLGFQTLGVVFVALAASLSVRYLGWGLGILVFAVAVWGIALRRGGLFHKYVNRLFAIDTPATGKLQTARDAAALRV